MILLKAVEHTYPVRERLSGNGFKWNAKDSCWEKVFMNRREYHKFMAYFLDDTEFDDISRNEKVVFKAFEVDEEDIKPDYVKELESLRATLCRFDKIKSVEEIKENDRLGLKIEGVVTQIYWYEEVDVKHLKREIESYEYILYDLKKWHDRNVESNDYQRLEEEEIIEFCCIPVYKFLINKSRKLKKFRRNCYEREVEVITKHIPKEIKPVEHNEINALKSE